MKCLVTAVTQVVLYCSRRTLCVKSKLNDLNKRVAGFQGDSTLIVSITGHLNVSLITPGGCPAVLDKPVILTVLGAVSNDQYGVIQIGQLVTTRGFDVDAASVTHERGSRRINCDGNGSNGRNGCLKGVFVPCWDVNESRVRSCVVLCVVITVSQLLRSLCWMIVIILIFP